MGTTLLRGALRAHGSLACCRYSKYSDASCATLPVDPVAGHRPGAIALARVNRRRQAVLGWSGSPQKRVHGQTCLIGSIDPATGNPYGVNLSVALNGIKCRGDRSVAPRTRQRAGEHRRASSAGPRRRRGRARRSLRACDSSAETVGERTPSSLDARHDRH